MYITRVLWAWSERIQLWKLFLVTVFVVSWLAKSNSSHSKFLGDVINYICYEICGSIFFLQITCVFAHGSFILSLFCWVYAWSLYLLSNSIWLQITWALKRVKNARYFVVSAHNMAITLLSCVGQVLASHLCEVITIEE